MMYKGISTNIEERTSAFDEVISTNNMVEIVDVVRNLVTTENSKKTKAVVYTEVYIEV